MYIGPLALAFVLYVQILKAILYHFEYTTPILSLWYSRCSDMQRHRAILHLFEYTTPVLSLWFSRCSNMQGRRAILHLFEYTTPVLSLWYIWCSHTQWHRRYCTLLNTQHQFCPCDISDAAICNISNFQRGFQFQMGDSFYKWWFYYFKLGFELFQTGVWKFDCIFLWPFAH